MVRTVFRLFFLIFVVFLGGDAFAQVPNPDQETPTLKRLVIVPPFGTLDPRVTRWLREDDGGGKRKTTRSRFSDLMQDKPAPELPPTGAQLQTYAGQVFAKTLAQRLQSRAKSLVLPPDKQRKNSEAILDKEQARQLCHDLEADALMQIALPRIEIREGAVRAVMVRIALHLPYARPSRPQSPPDSDPMFAFASLSAAGTDATGRNLLRGTYTDSLRDQVKTAAKQAAARAVHQLLTQTADPLTETGRRIAILPVSAPTTADVLRFTPQGRILQKAGITGLSSDMSDLFAPDLLPVGEENLIAAREMQTLLLRRGDTATSAWHSATVPHVVQVQQWGKAARADYVLMAHVTSLEMEESPIEGNGKDREAQAEAFGALIRVADGNILWQERASASLRVRPRIKQRKIETDAEILHDTTMFALLELQRRFARYRAQFEK